MCATQHAHLNGNSSRGAASGTRITTHLIYELKRRGKRFGVGSACIGGGQGIAVVVEAL